LAGATRTGAGGGVCAAASMIDAVKASRKAARIDLGFMDKETPISQLM